MIIMFIDFNSYVQDCKVPLAWSRDFLEMDFVFPINKFVTPFHKIFRQHKRVILLQSRCTDFQ